MAGAISHDGESCQFARAIVSRAGFHYLAIDILLASSNSALFWSFLVHALQFKLYPWHPRGGGVMTSRLELCHNVKQFSTPSLSPLSIGTK